MVASAASGGTGDPAAHLFQVVWDSHLHAAFAALARERGERIARVGASGVEFSGSPLLSIWAVEAKHLEDLVRTVTADFEKRAPQKYLTPKRLPVALEAAGAAVRSAAGRALCQTPMHGREDAGRGEEFRARTVLHLDGVIEAQLRAAVYTSEANKEPWWKRTLSAFWEVLKLVRP
jgi:hypothetical protein